jgi:hypothetical protein
MRKAKTIIHVNQHIIKSNSKNDERHPVLTCKHRKENNYAHEAIILDKDGNECARVIYRPDNPLSCGAKVWIETYNEVNLIKDKYATVESECLENNCQR